VSPGRLLPVSEPEIDTLFGTLSKLDYELAVLWAVDFKAKSLDKAVLAAVVNMDDPKKTVIYAEEALPAPLAVTLASAPTPPQDESTITDTNDTKVPTGFGDLFGEEEEGAGESS
jgi:hypothetical protein